MLEKYRIKPNREFFKIDNIKEVIDIIEHEINVINNMEWCEYRKEIEKLKEELLRVRRIEKQKDREVLFLQKQLSAAAARLSRTESIEENLNG